jgi:hypothetical protein
MLHDGERFARLDLVAEFWIARALFEESFGNHDEVVQVFESAVERGAQPMETLFRGLNTFMLRRRDSLLCNELDEQQSHQQSNNLEV